MRKMDVKTLGLSLVLLVSVQCKPASDAQILRYDNNLREDGYDFSYETSDGIKRSENGILKPGKEGDTILNVKGEFSFTFPDGTPFLVNFISDENGYQPKVTIGQKQIPSIGYAAIPSAAIASLAGGGLG